MLKDFLNITWIPMNQLKQRWIKEVKIDQLLQQK